MDQQEHEQEQRQEHELEEHELARDDNAGASMGYPTRRHPWGSLDTPTLVATVAPAVTHAATNNGAAVHQRNDQSTKSTTKKKDTHKSGSRSGSRTSSASSSAPSSAPVERLLTKRDDAILHAMATYQYLSADQVRRLGGYSHGSLDAVRKQLKQLVEDSYVLRMRLPRASAGNAPWVYGLDRLGSAYLEATIGASDDSASLGRFRASEQYERSYLFLTHTLAVNDFLIAASLLEREVPTVRLAELRPEHALKRTPVRVALGPAEKQTVILDGWLDFHLHGTLRLCIGLERDRATEAEGAFVRKLRGLLAFAVGPYQEAFGVDSLTVAFATTAGPRRVEQMRAWCERILRDAGREEDADLFFLASLPEGELDPKTVFLAPIWSRPFATNRAPLLELQP